LQVARLCEYWARGIFYSGKQQQLTSALTDGRKLKNLNRKKAEAEAEAKAKGRLQVIQVTGCRLQGCVGFGLGK
jgi:hypothetical protein